MSISSGLSSSFGGSSFLRLAISGEAGLLLLAWALARWLDVSPLQELGPIGPGLLWGFLATLPLLLGLSWILRSTREPFRRLVTLVVHEIGPLLAPLSLFELALLALTAGISEEILFRGVIQVGLAHWISAGWALLITGLVFGLVHFASRTYAVFAAVMGWYLGTLYLAQQSLLAPIVAHGLYDFVALFAVRQRARAGPPSDPVTQLDQTR